MRSCSSDAEELLKAARVRAAIWLSLDKCKEARAAVQLLVAASEKDEESRTALIERFGHPLAFGTAGFSSAALTALIFAGLRGVMEPGFSRMNKITVQLASQGLGEYLLDEKSGRPLLTAVIGYDHRHNSTDFANVAAATLLCLGISVHLFQEAVPTPFVPYSVVRLNADVGIMITASHNPKQDNGYKVYSSKGHQIVDNEARGIEQYIRRQNDRLWDICTDKKAIAEQSKDPAKLIMQAYLEDLAHLSIIECAATLLKAVYTPLHGVGYKFVAKAVERLGLPAMTPVSEQIQPNPDFPTVSFPNPEEGKHVWRLAMETADKVGASVVFANDPDADRFAAAEKTSAGWKIFTGNEIASFVVITLLVLVDSAMLGSFVSTRMVQKMAEQEGFAFYITETGFKNLSAKAKALSNAGANILLAFEEAIGFQIGTNVWDKDGISALAVFYGLSSKLYEQGETIGAYLERLYQKYDYFTQSNSYYICKPASCIPAVFNDICTRVGNLETPSIGQYTATKIHVSANSVNFQFDDIRAWLTIRISGTEPKIKYYSEMSGGFGDRKMIEDDLACLVDAVCTTFLRPKDYQLEPKSE